VPQYLLGDEQSGFTDGDDILSVAVGFGMRESPAGAFFK
jgi:hypothetical protein